MDKPPKEMPVPDWLLAQLEQSREDLAAGRVVPVGPVLAEVRARALRRIEERRVRLKDGRKSAVQA